LVYNGCAQDAAAVGVEVVVVIVFVVVAVAVGVVWVSRHFLLSLECKFVNVLLLRNGSEGGGEKEEEGRRRREEEGREMTGAFMLDESDSQLNKLCDVKGGWVYVLAESNATVIMKI
jgi:hypothetical protein